MLSLRLPNDVESRLNQLAETTGRTKTFYAKEAILRYLDDMEDTYIAINRLESPSKRISLEDVENELALDDQMTEKWQVAWDERALKELKKIDKQA